MAQTPRPTTSWLLAGGCSLDGDGGGGDDDDDDDDDDNDDDGSFSIVLA